MKDFINKHFCSMQCGTEVKPSEMRCEKCKVNPMWSIIEYYGVKNRTDDNPFIYGDLMGK